MPDDRAPLVRHAVREGALIGRRALLKAGAAGAAAWLGGCQAGPPPGRKVATLWFTYGGKNRQTLERLIEAFHAEQERWWVQATFQGDYFEGLAKLRTALAARAAPTFSHVVGEVVPYLAEAGVLEPLDSLPGARALDLVPALGQRGTWVGGADRPLVALPFNRSTPIAYLNGDVLEKEGGEAPTTWLELLELARWLTVRRGRGAGAVVERHGFGCPVDWWFWCAQLGQAGGELADPDGTITLGGTAGVKALELWHLLVHQEGLMKPPPGRDYNAWEATNQDFLAGRTAMIWTSTAFVRYLEDNARFRVIAAPLPGHERRAVPTGGTHWVVLRGAPDDAKEAAWAFLRFMHRPEVAADWATSTGYIPVTRGAISALEARGYYGSHPNDRVAVDQLEVARPWPWSRELFRVQREVVQPRLELAVLTGKSPRLVMEDARRALGRRAG